MAKLLCYTSPARGHLFPVMPTLLEVARRGHEVVLLTLADEAPRVAAAGLRARAIAGSIEAIPHDDHRAKSAGDGLDRAARVFVARAEHEIPDLEAALAAERPDALLVDFNCWGASAVAERSGLPWALFMPYFLPWRLPGLPPFGPGLAPRGDVFGRARDFVAGKIVHRLMNQNLARMNGVRARVGLPGLADMLEQGRAAPRILYYTSEPFEYACSARPASVVMVGPGLFEPPSARPEWLDRVDRPLILVACSSEYQDDGAIVHAALDAFGDEDAFVVATTGGVDPASFRPRARANVRVERFVAHGPLLERAACVVCHGGMGITQKALAASVPVCVVPFGRDQLEVARHVEVARAGVRIDRRSLTPARLRVAVHAAMALNEGAGRVAAGFRAAGGAARAASELEQLMAARTDRWH
ncbi:MAG TPA: glycosyltransferase [Polyangiaceae bacterium]|nr:glycosyltransferase [Polyangiaceae bacterium]